jgi:prophage regulatory protein
LFLEAQVKFLNHAGLREKGIGWTRQHLGRLERRNQFPKRVRLGPNSIAWREDEIEAWLAARVAERDQGEAA